MLARSALFVLLAIGLRGCVAYEYEHEFWLRVDGSGSVYVSGRPSLWGAFKGLPVDQDEGRLKEAARALFEKSGLRVRRVTVTRRRGQPNLFLAADFEDVNRLAGTAAFPDLRISLVRQAERLRLSGSWQRPAETLTPPGAPVAGLTAVRFHLPSKVYAHDNAFDGVERGNIVAWRQEVAPALQGQRLAFGALMDPRSILLSTVSVFAAAILAGLGLIGLALYLTLRKGRRGLAAS